MARNNRFRVAFRRRREGKTDYKLRRALVISRKKRVVIRKSNRNIRLQLISSHAEGDKTHLSISSKNLESYQWKGSTNNLPSSYLTGYMFGKKALEKGFKDEELILDMGLNRKFYGSRIFTALKGAVDAGLNINHSEEIFPSDERIQGQHISDYSKQLANDDKDKHKKVFSKYIPDKLPDMFNVVKKKISGDK